jgi:hypothetical protein
MNDSDFNKSFMWNQNKRPQLAMCQVDEEIKNNCSSSLVNYKCNTIQSNEPVFGLSVTRQENNRFQHIEKMLMINDCTDPDDCDVISQQRGIFSNLHLVYSVICF